MSHFTVLVIGDDVEKQLAPFHEFECTGLDDEFVQDIDITASAHEDFQEYGEGKSFEEFVAGWFGYKKVEDGYEPDLEGVHKYGYFCVVDGAVRVIDRTNPNKKWDWYSIGGRWSGAMKLKPGTAGVLGRKGVLGSCRNDGPGYADQARKGDIDIAGMRDEAEKKAASRYDAFRAVVGDRTWETWDEVRDRMAGDITGARAFYHEQEAYTLAKAANLPDDVVDLWSGIDEFHCSRSEFIDRARSRAFCAYAVVKDRQWTERGEMGWFGMSSNEMDYEAWLAKFNEVIDALPDETLLTFVDCHI